MAFRLSGQVVYELALVSLGSLVSITFISMGYFEPIISGLISILVGFIIAQFDGSVKYFGYGLVGGAVGLLVYYYIPRSMASSVQELKRY